VRRGGPTESLEIFMPARRPWEQAPDRWQPGDQEMHVFRASFTVDAS